MLAWRYAAAAAAAVSAAVVAYRMRHPAHRRRRVVVCSTSKQKKAAVEAALSATVISCKAPSLVSDQPIGLDETLRGAKNRLAAILEGSDAEGADLAVAIENGVMRLLGGDEEVWVDIAVVLLRDLATGAQSVSTSAGVQFPTAAVGDWAEAGGEGTIGDVLAESLACDKQDPHVALTKGSFSRARLLENAIRVAQASLP